ncbi:class I adenylate-forming enzyme family protein [Bradyrhizobium sp. DASA03007]|uniref:class I adenylate-forming enzyme family protein n=1 Tax=unclassified Bradyrhizobium TaxID=2631580 RepID=UPI003F71DF41
MGELTSLEAIARLTAPGAPFEMQEVVIRGVRTRTWKHTPENLRVILEASRRHGELPFLVYEDEQLSFAEHFRRCTVLAQALHDRFGIRKGDRIAIVMRNYPEWSISFFAAVAIGAIAVPLNAWMTGAELEYCLSDSGCCALVADAERIQRLAPHLGALPALRAAIVVRHTAPLSPGLHNWGDIVPAEAPALELPNVTVAPDDDATIFYTSGTTGKPRGALGTHRNICTSPVSVAFGRARAQLVVGRALPDPAKTPKRALLLPVPLFHVTGCHAALIPNIAAGNKLVLMYRWDPERAMQLIESEKINAFTGVPTIGWQILEHPAFGRYDLSSLEQISLGGAPTPPELLLQIRQNIPGVAMTNGYGLTESSAAISQNVGREYVAKPESIGLPIAVCDIRIAGDDGTDLPPGSAGELWVRGPNVVKGYWNDPKATDATFSDGWLRTGDIVRTDREGFLYLLDRAKDIVIRGGENIYCVEVEDVLYSHPAIIDAAVIGIPHNVLGEEVGAVVRVKPGATVTADELKAHVASRLAAFKVPTRIELRREALPRNAVGKLLKRELRLS